MQKTEEDTNVVTARRQPKVSMASERKILVRQSDKTNVTATVKRSPKVSHFNTHTERQANIIREKVTVHPMQKRANDELRQRNQRQEEQIRMASAKELKDQAIRKALANASAMPEDGSEMSNSKAKMQFGFGRLALALACTIIVVFGIVYFVNLNMPDISLKVAAMQTGINASYPSYVPRDFGVSGITSEDGKITIVFRNSKTGDEFSLIEESSSWDSNALMTNYVQPTFKDNYAIVREQGLTLYISDSNAAWVNGGIVYKLNTTSGSLTHKQIRSIAVSL
ncbi:hypothetical protein IKF92_00505 [Candidatus Saccharibacteria bacterium]|nr:hypothetical protein [Candidatus Saccharibacteria bacterium]